MYVKKGKVNIVKGFMTFDSFYEYLMKLDKLYDLKQKALVMHFRISTQGNVDAGNCHPFPITSSKKMLRSTICKKIGRSESKIHAMWFTSISITILCSLSSNILHSHTFLYNDITVTGLQIKDLPQNATYIAFTPHTYNKTNYAIDLDNVSNLYLICQNVNTDQDLPDSIYSLPDS